MRTTAFVLFALFVIACAAPQSERQPLSNATAAPIAVEIELDATLRERLALGLPLYLALRTANADVGACTVVHDLWEEDYRVAFSKTEELRATDPNAALRMCVDMDRVKRVARGRRVATISVHEVPPPKPLYQRVAYPEF
jgi:hypothetical protein